MKINNTKLPVVIIPFSLPLDWSADYQKRTILELLHKNYSVVAYMSTKAHFFLKKNNESYPKIPGVTFYVPKYYIPLRRFQYIEKLNKYLSLFILSASLLNKSKIIWIFDPIFDYFPKFFRKKITVYDCVDFHDRVHSYQENTLIKKSDFFFVNSRALFAAHKKTRKATKILVQGFNIREFSQHIKSIKKKKKSKKITIGYVGGINHRLDFKILLPLIKNNPKWNFEFWGPKQKSQTEDKIYNTWEHISEINKLPNVSFEKTLNKKKLIQVINSFDVCLIPYDISQEFNLYCHPMKVFEYFYLGKPVITTPIQELTANSFKDLLFTATSASGFEKHIHQIIKKGWPKSQVIKQKKLARANSWENKVATILDTVHNAKNL